MPQQPKTGQVGTCSCPKLAQALGRQTIGVAHGLQGLINPTAFGLKPRVSGKQGARADRFCQDQDVAWAHAPFAHDLVRPIVNQAVDGKAQRKFLTFTSVPPNQRTVGVVEYL